MHGATIKINIYLTSTSKSRKFNDVKLSLSVSWRHIVGTEVQTYSLLTLSLGKVTGKHHAPTALPLGGKKPVLIEQDGSGLHIRFGRIVQDKSSLLFPKF